LAQEGQAKRRLEWTTSGSLINPDYRDLLRFEQKNGMLRNILAPEVPGLAAEQAQRVFEQVIGNAGVQRSEVKGWILHPGGRDVLTAIQGRLELSDEQVRWSASVLSEFGNLSSASVYFVLEAALSDSVPSGYWWMSSFGAGFSGHGALLKAQ
jgi:alkylresorcinol/alkylpyrone synthase